MISTTDDRIEEGSFDWEGLNKDKASDADGPSNTSLRPPGAIGLLKLDSLKTGPTPARNKLGNSPNSIEPRKIDDD